MVHVFRVLPSLLAALFVAYGKRTRAVPHLSPQLRPPLVPRTSSHALLPTTGARAPNAAASMGSSAAGQRSIAADGRAVQTRAAPHAQSDAGAPRDSDSRWNELMTALRDQPGASSEAISDRTEARVPQTVRAKYSGRPGLGALGGDGSAGASGGTGAARGGILAGSSRLTQRVGNTERKAGDAFVDLSAVEAPITAYVNIWKPLFLSAKESGLAPEFVLRWGHPAAMGIVLLAMGGYGTFLGWSTRLGNGDTVYPLNLGQKSRDMHPLLMGAALFFFLLGGQGGLVLLATAGQPILSSAHSSTAVLGLSCMAAQAVLGLTMGDSEFKRTAHAVFGTGVMLLLLAHMYFGLGLGSAIFT